MHYPRDGRGWGKRLLHESTALLEIGAGLALHRQLVRLAPDGDGHPVVLIPGFTASDRSTGQLRRFLRDCGNIAEGWGQGRNMGVNKIALQGLQDHVLQLAGRYGERVSVIGWSAGGLYARAMGHRVPEQLRVVITMGSPFKLSEDTLHHLPDGIHQLHRRLSPRDEAADDEMNADSWVEPPPVPSTSLYSQRDGLAPWPFCLDRRDHCSENVQVPGSHAGMPFNPLMYYIIADRLAQPRDNWQPFELSQGFLHGLYRHGCASELSDSQASGAA